MFFARTAQNNMDWESIMVDYNLPLSIIMDKLRKAGAEYNQREVIMYAWSFLFESIESLKKMNGEDIKKAIENDIRRRYASARPY